MCKNELISTQRQLIKSSYKSARTNPMYYTELYVATEITHLVQVILTSHKSAHYFIAVPSLCCTLSHQSLQQALTNSSCQYRGEGGNWFQLSTANDVHKYAYMMCICVVLGCCRCVAGDFTGNVELLFYLMFQILNSTQLEDLIHY